MTEIMIEPDNAMYERMTEAFYRKMRGALALRGDREFGEALRDAVSTMIIDTQLVLSGDLAIDGYEGGEDPPPVVVPTRRVVTSLSRWQVFGVSFVGVVFGMVGMHLSDLGLI